MALKWKMIAFGVLYVGPVHYLRDLKNTEKHNF